MGIVWDINVERPEFPQLTTNLEADLVVVGLGGSGLTALLHAAERGLNVIGIDADRIAAGAAGRNGGLPALLTFITTSVKIWELIVQRRFTNTRLMKWIESRQLLPKQFLESAHYALAN
jgi:hypothetical protein